MSNSLQGLPGGSMVKNPPANAGDTGWIPESGRSPGEGNANLLRYSCLGNPMDRETWWATVHEVAKDTAWQLNNQYSPSSANSDFVLFVSAFLRG